MGNTVGEWSDQDRPEVSRTSSDVLASDPSDAFSLDISGFIGLLKRNVKLLGAMMLASVLIAVAVTLLATPVYEATSVIRFEADATQTVQIGSSGGAVASPGDFERMAETQVELIQSRAIAEMVFEQAKLGANREFLALVGVEASGADGQAAVQEREEIEKASVAYLQSGVSVEAIAKTELTNINFSSSDPRLAARIANAYASATERMDLQHKFNGSSYAREYLKNQLGLARERLEQSEMALNAYLAMNGLIAISPGGEDGSGATTVVSDLANSATTANEATNARIAAEQAWRTAQSKPIMNVPQVLADAQVQQLRSQLANARAKLTQDRNTYGKAHPAVQADQEAVDAISAALRSAAQEVLNGLRTTYETALKQEEALLSRVNGLKDDAVSEERLGVRSNILRREVATNRSLYDALLQRQKEVAAAAGINKSAVSVVDAAVVPSSPVSPNLWLNLAVSIFAGLFFGLLVVLVKSQLNRQLHTPEDFAAATGLPLLGIVPHLDADESIGAELDKPRSSLSEAFNTVLTHTALARPGGLPRVFQVTSSLEGEGKSATSFALARSIAKRGARVLVIDADLRRPSMHVYFGAREAKLGLAEVLSNNASFEDAVQSTAYENISVLVAGTIPPSPTELLAHSNLAALIKKAQSEYDFVLVDGPPLLGLADALLLGSCVKSVIFVSESGRVTRPSLRHALERLGKASPDVLGLVVSKFKASNDTDYYYYATNYSYGSNGD
ncbi:GumC family protein [Novosphingobium mangrovi (ex Hu et al. 2023)]|uniref:non-specific protein-tyrosine kinase n=1 Tax=Novosphingobium mangrovi (ex Hu et al. 2023) TaxID=2930094 RepID=A0ABT0ACB7_9SPHN|nr:polysaccharide biosynthesis tyrosine autokinase [Novosphingobium mangrovi (ex Hu et al. 2023)]MCJ1960830.1 polysaccharide biosynthesis tyrosine autokinase [Novosphingobium mangrovi (ex Hu et al. 2023)]